MTMTTSEYDNKVFVVDKAAGPTSFDIVEAMRRVTGLRKVGHAGTLDPLARGVLLLCTGLATRAVEHLMNLEKEYAFSVRLGAETTTLDAEGEVVREGPCPEASLAELRETAATFVGPYQLTPPRFSAVKRGGRRMYEMARNGELGSVNPPERTVHIYAFDVAGEDLPDVHCVVRCSRGTYVRSLARDFGRRLGVPAHVASLTRSRVGPFSIADGFPSQRLESGDVEGLVGIDTGEALGFLPGVVLSSRARRALAYGTLPEPGDVVRSIGTATAGAVRMLDEAGRLIAVGMRREGEDRNRLRVVDSFRLFVDPQSISSSDRKA
jgi:tRNA pseudouridine55 synthase